MALLTAGRTTNCISSFCSGGISDFVYLANANDVTSIQYGADGKATAVTMVAEKVFYAYDFRDFSAQFTETVTVNEETRAVSVRQQMEMIWTCRNHEDRTLIQTIATNSCGMIAIHEENTGVAWIWGTLPKRRVFLGTSEGVSGLRIEDSNQEAITLICNTTEKAVEWSGVTIPV